METFVVVKRPGHPAELVRAPAALDLAFVRMFTSGYVELLQKGSSLSDVLDALTIFIEDGRDETMRANLALPGRVVAGPLLACLTSAEGEEHGLCLEHAEAVARALDHYGVGLERKAN